MIKVHASSAVARAVAEVSDEIAIFYEAKPPPARRMLWRPMGRRPKRDMGGIARQIAAAAAAGKFQLDIRVAEDRDIAIAPSIDLKSGKEHPAHSSGSSKIEKLFNAKRARCSPVHNPIVGGRR